MDVRLSPEQQEIRAHFAGLFSEELSPAIRRMGHLGKGVADDDNADARQAVWQALTELGATRLCLPERFGGRGLGQSAMVMLAELQGIALYQSPLADTLTTLELLLAAGEEHDGLIKEIGQGARFAIAARDQAAASPADPGPLAADPEGTRIHAARCFVACAAEAEYLLVAGRETGEGARGAGGVRLAVVRRDDPTVTLRRHEEISRGELYQVRCEGTPVLAWAGGPGDAEQAWRAALDGARIRHAAYLVGLCQGALDLAVGYAKERRQFGQPIGKFQAIALRLAEAAIKVQAARLLVHASAWEHDQGRDVRLDAACTLAMAADTTRETITEAMQVNGAFGTTEQADAQLFYRRAAIDTLWLGSPTQLRAEVLALTAAAPGQRPGSPPHTALA
jgi:butyryl-CoA dehydrogenase